MWVSEISKIFYRYIYIQTDIHFWIFTVNLCHCILRMNQTERQYWDWRQSKQRDHFLHWEIRAVKVSTRGGMRVHGFVIYPGYLSSAWLGSSVLQHVEVSCSEQQWLSVAFTHLQTVIMIIILFIITHSVSGGRDPHLNAFLSIYYFFVLIKWLFFSVTEYFSLFLNSFVISDAHSYT